MSKQIKEILSEIVKKHNMLNDIVFHYALVTVIWLTALTIWMVFK